MGKTSIEWTDATWNPVRGCTKVSPGCKHCYAETFAERWRGVPGHPYEQGFDLRLVPEKLPEPLRWKTPQHVFVNSMSDLFHEDVPREYIASVFGVMASCPQHTFQVLTKRARRMEEWFQWVGTTTADVPGGDGQVRMCLRQADRHVARQRHISYPLWPLSNVWLGVSVEDRKYGLPRIEHLRNTPAAVRVLSIEPLLEDLGKLDLRGIDQVIVGGESGPGARPLHPGWARSIRDQCVAAGVAFFFKQHGAWASVSEVEGPGAHHRFPDGTTVRRVGKAKAGRVLDGRTWDEMPEVARG